MGYRAPSPQIVALGSRRRVLRAFVPLTGSGESGWVQLAMTGRWAGHEAGEFAFDAKVFDAIVRRFEDQRNPLVFDFEHQSVNENLNGPAPAAGWIHRLERRGDGDDAELWAFVEWTADAARLIKSGAYRYSSPVVDFDSTDRRTGESVGPELFNAALTNNPFLDGQRPIALSCVGRPMANQLKLNAIEALDKAKEKLGPEASADGVLQAVMEVLGEESSAEEEVAPMMDEPSEPAEMESPADDVPPAPAVAAMDDPEEDIEMADGDPGVDVDANAVVETLAQAAGIDKAAAVALMQEKIDEIAQLINRAADADGIPAEMADDAESAVELSALRSQLSKRDEQITKLSARLDELEGEKRAREQAAVESEVDGYIADGQLEAEQRDNAIRMLSRSPEDFRALFSVRKPPAMQAGAGSPSGAAPTDTVSDDDLTESERSRFVTMKAARVCGGKPDAIRRLIVSQRSN